MVSIKRKQRIMKLTKNIVLVFIGIMPFLGWSQNSNEKSDEVEKGVTETKADKKSYYTQRAEEDAKFEQQFNAESDKEEKEFWEEQKAYEKNLKKRDKKAYKAYRKGKQDAYKEHYRHCDRHCHHSDYYYGYASHYYYGYNSHYYYERQPSYRRTRIRVKTPSVRIGF